MKSENKALAYISIMNHWSFDTAGRAVIPLGHSRLNSFNHNTTHNYWFNFLFEFGVLFISCPSALHFHQVIIKHFGAYFENICVMKIQRDFIKDITQ